MPLSNAQKQKDTRARRKAKLERLARYEAALQSILWEAEREEGGWVHLKRAIAVHARQALNPTTGDDA